MKHKSHKRNKGRPARKKKRDMTPIYKAVSLSVPETESVVRLSKNMP
jgi:hypothetical protein